MSLDVIQKKLFNPLDQAFLLFKWKLNGAHATNGELGDAFVIPVIQPIESMLWPYHGTPACEGLHPGQSSVSS